MREARFSDAVFLEFENTTAIYPGGARHVRVLPITAEIVVLSQSDMFSHGDPADRLIAATARLHRAPLIASDAKLRKLKEVATIW